MAHSEPFLFVSHVSEDRAAAMAIVDELERRGITCWIAPRDIEPGHPFDDAIVSALDRAAMQSPRSLRTRAAHFWPSSIVLMPR